MITAIKGEVKLVGNHSEVMIDACTIFTALNNKGLLKPSLEMFGKLLDIQHEIFDIKPTVDKTREWEEE